MSDSEIRGRLEVVEESLARAAERVGRDPAGIRVLPITKGHPLGLVQRVAALGFEIIGESRVAEAEAKQNALGTLGLRWHLVGHLQRNKAARAVQLFDVIESVDSLRLGQRIDAVAERTGLGRVPVLVQVNASGEAAKGGFPLSEADEAIGELCELPRLEVRGLMTMAPFVDDEDTLRDCFRRTRECLERCRRAISGLRGIELSMGMSNDFELAVEEGSTEVRLGTILLGERPGR